MRRKLQKIQILLQVLTIFGIMLFFSYLYSLDFLRTYNLPTKQSERWVVLDDVRTTCADVTTLTKQADWSVVIVVEKDKEIAGCSLPTCYKLTRQDIINNMGHFLISRFIDTPSKLWGYLFAIQNGAQVILDTECNAQVETISQSFHINKHHQSGLFHNSSSIFNPFYHYGITDAFPLESVIYRPTNRDVRNISKETNSDIFYIADWNSVPIRQGVLVSKTTCYKYKQETVITSNAISSSPVAVGYPSFAPYSTGPTIFFKKVFPLLFLPPNLDLPRRQLFRTLLINAFTKNTQINSAFYNVDTHLDTNNDCILLSSHQVNLQSKSSFPCLNVEFCSISEYGCNIQELFHKISSCLVKQFLPRENVSAMKLLITAWGEDLQKFEMNEEVNSDNDNKVMFKTVYKIPQQVNLFRNISYDIVKTILKDVISLCGVQKTKSWDPIKNILHPLIDDILLIVVFNYNNVYNSLGFNEYLHRQYFKYIIYCVPSVSNFQNYTEKTGFHYVSFIEGLADDGLADDGLAEEGWYFFYQCVSAAMKLDLPVKGYLQIGDDVLLNSWNILTIPRNEMMVFSEEKYVDLYKDDPDFQWDYWETGQKDIQNVISELQKLSSGDEDFSKAYPLVNVTYFATNFLQNLQGNLEPNFVAYGATDIFYVPKVLKNEYITASELFRKYHCMVELALRNIYLGLKRPREQKFLFEGRALWDADREKPWVYFNGVNDTFIHPYKWLRDAWKKEGRRFACRRYLPLHSLRKPS